MDNIHYYEMKRNFNQLIRENKARGKSIYLFGHCNASEMLADLFRKEGYLVKAILDNNSSKYRTSYRGIPIVAPYEVLDEEPEKVLVCIVARASASMEKQLIQMGYGGEIEKLVVYNSYAEYSFSEDTISKKQKRVERGICLLEQERKRYPGCYRIYCPFPALGDVYYMMTYLPYFLTKKNITDYVVFTVGKACRDVVKLFGTKNADVMSQENMDESIQAVLYTRDADAFIPHQDRPYVVNLAKALHVKKIPLELIYKYGVFGLDAGCIPYKPTKLRKYTVPEKMIYGKSVILSPYAKSVTNIPSNYWEQIIKFYRNRKFSVFTNAVNGEVTLPGTIRLEISLDQMQSAVEQAGIFIGLRSGLCDVINEAECEKIALYPDCYYSDTRWKMEEIYHLDGWKNIVIG